MWSKNAYAYANPFHEPVSFDTLAVPDTDDNCVLTHRGSDPMPISSAISKRMLRIEANRGIPLAALRGRMLLQ